jgi:acyl-[acyl-carrier-protein]-phospholipid O-acyltransferase/long-chain-fatty-acid--[acyl-carrier-protein] ligase
MILHEQFIRMAKKNPARMAIIDRTLDRRVTYSKALIGSIILSKRFKKESSNFIGVMVPTSAGCTLATLGVLMSGHTPVMINYSTGAETNARYAQQKCGFSTIITSKALLEKIGCPKLEGMIFLEDIMAGITTGEKIKAALISKLPVSAIIKLTYKGKEDDIVAMLFTSGSEKDPKAVPLTNRNISSNIESFGGYVGIGDKDTILANLVFFHIFGLTVNLWVPLYYGITMITYANPLDFVTVSKIAREEKPTMMVGTPSFFWGYLHKSEPGDFKSVRIMVSGADKCPDALREGYIKKHGVTLLEGYGATETSPVISVNSHEFNRPGSTGKPIPGVLVRIEHLESGEECRPGEIGKILVKGPSVMAGYYKDPQLTEEALKDGWYNTGDMGYFDEEGYLYHSGRFKRFVKIGGEMVSLVKVENTLEKHLPAGVSCCVVDVHDEVKGSSIIATVTIEVNKSEILKKMGEELPNIALPKHFVVIRDLPMMGTGKIDFRSVTKIVQEIFDKEQ